LINFVVFMNLFVTVGSTKFDKLIELIKENIDAIVERGIIIIITVIM
jgi:UDP-N-acetylglucosamine transferase subunit ALG13